jgi:hypothetical protein
MSARFPLPTILLRHCLRTFAESFASAADALNMAAATRHGREKPAPVDVAKFEAKPLSLKFHVDGSISIDPTTEDGLLLSVGTSDVATTNDAAIHVAARCIATAVALLEKANKS